MLELPHSKDAELLTLGLMLTSTDNLNIGIKALSENDFYFKENKIVFLALKTICLKNKPADVHLIAEELKQEGKLEVIGGFVYLVTLVQYAGTSAYIEEYIEILHNQSDLRAIIVITQDIQREALNRPENVQLFKNDIEAKFSLIRRCRGSVVGLNEQIEAEQKETVESFLKTHKETYSNGILLAGFGEIDKNLFYAPGDLIIIQGMSNHGKTKWMEQKAYNFLTNDRNVEKNPICVFISFENSPLFVKQDFLNLISKHQDEGEKFISYDHRYHDTRGVESPFLYPNLENEFHHTISIYERWKQNQSIIFIENIQFENLSTLVIKLKEKNPNRPIAIFLDYIQIIPSAFHSVGWEKIKEISYGLEKLAQQNKVIIIAGSQVNEKRETREGKDVYNAATIVEDVFNHSHSSLQLNEILNSKYIMKIEGKNVVSIAIIKCKRGASFLLKEAFLFDGYAFEERKEVRNDSSSGLKDYEFNRGGKINKKTSCK